jgi:HSP20 family protein
MPEGKNDGPDKAGGTRQPGQERPDHAEPRVSAGATIRTAAGGAPLGLDALFSWLGGVVDQLGDVAGGGKGETGSGEFVRHGEFKPSGFGDKARGVYGVRVRMGAGGQASFEPFGNIRPTAKGAEVSEVREPMVDVFDEDGVVLVVAEMPGASEADITMTVEGSVLKLRADGEHRYAKDVTLPAKTEPEPARKVYRNGLIELRFNKI